VTSIRVPHVAESQLRIGVHRGNLSFPVVRLAGLTHVAPPVCPVAAPVCSEGNRLATLLSFFWI
jgi:hypothetical protein